MRRRDFIKVSLQSIALAYVASVAGCGDSENITFATPSSGGSSPPLAGTSTSTTTLTEFAANGRRFAVEPFSNTVRAYDPNGVELFQLASAPGNDSGGALNYPVAAESGADGRSYIASYGSNRIVLIDQQGQATGELGESEDLLYPSDVALYEPEGELFVADSLNHRVVVYGTDGVFLRAFGELGSEPGQLNGPGSVELASDATLWVLDAGNQRLQRFSRTGEVLQELGGEGKAPGQFLGLSGLGIDPTNGDLYTCDQITGLVTIFKSDGSFDYRFRVVGDDGQLASPTDVTVDDEFIYLYLVEGASVYDDPDFAGEVKIS